MKKTLDDAIKGIKEAEKDVDRVLNAANLQRTPKNREISDIWYLIMGFIALIVLIAVVALVLR